MTTLRVVLAPDSFKGSLSAEEVCAALARGLARAAPDVEVRARPMADGGEGTLDAVLAAVGASGRREHARVTGAGGEPIDAAYGLVTHDEGLTAVLEAAQVVGITDPAGMSVPVATRSTRGLGELVKHLLDAGVRRFMVGLGGSSTNDGGSGLLSALGVALIGDTGRADRPDSERASVACAHHAGRPRPAARRMRVPDHVRRQQSADRRPGATAIFGPQKGVPPGEVEPFDRDDRPLRDLARSRLRPRSSGPAGRRGRRRAGFCVPAPRRHDAVRRGSGRRAHRAAAAIDGADWVITGEGRSDRQTLLAKAPFVVARHAAAHGVPVTLVSGAIDPAALADLGRHFAGCFGLPNGPLPLAECIARAPELLEARAEQLARVFLARRSGFPRTVE